MGSTMQDKCAAGQIAIVLVSMEAKRDLPKCVQNTFWVLWLIESHTLAIHLRFAGKLDSDTSPMLTLISTDTGKWRRIPLHDLKSEDEPQFICEKNSDLR